MTEKRFIPPHGGYRDLITYRKAELIYDATVAFCKRFLKSDRRTTSQMVQAARSGKQNILEGSMASGTSKEAEIKLTGVARSSLTELLADYEDFLRTRDLEQWPKDDPRVSAARRRGRNPQHQSYSSYRSHIENGPREVAANTMICLINQATYLLRRQLQELEKQFVNDGGLRERMTRARIEERERRRKT